MILIADSGSTKCAWVLCNNKGEIINEYKTIGFNPFFINQENILNHLEKSELRLIKEKVKNLIFYGAGCSSQEKKNIIQESLNTFFKKSNIIIQEDIYAACYATYKNQPNITCILGTGSNSCYYDGKKIKKKAPSLGFLLGDECSGNYFGKKILRLYLNHKLPKELETKFKLNHEDDWNVIKNNIYNNNRANVYLSKYFPFISSNKNHPLIQEIIYKALNEFFTLHICCYQKYKNVEINFVGSVAYHLSKEIKDVIRKNNCKFGRIVKDPIKELVKFHSKENIKDS